MEFKDEKKCNDREDYNARDRKKDFDCKHHDCRDNDCRDCDNYCEKCHIRICCCRGAIGATGATGAAGATGTCECRCRSIGEQIINGGMESFTDDIPRSWTTATPDLVSEVTAQGRVHSGNSSVNLENGANLSQTVTAVNGGCYYEFSFFAHGEGAQVGLTATVTFVTPTGNVNGATIMVNQHDLPDSDRAFAYYRVTTTAAPMNVTSAIINFSVTANGQQSLDLEDVSFKVD